MKYDISRAISGVKKSRKKIGLNLDEDCEKIKLLRCLVKGKKAEDAKDTRWLDATITQLLQLLDMSPNAALTSSVRCTSSVPHYYLCLRQK